MPSLKAIRKRIVSVRNTRKITSAMKLVAGAKLRRAQEAIWAARPYAARLADVIGQVAARIDIRSVTDEELDRPLPPLEGDAGIEERGRYNLLKAAKLIATRPEPRRVALIVMTSDRGLAGAFNSNVNRRTDRFLIDNASKHESISLYIVGRKGREYFKRKKVRIAREWGAPGASAAALSTAREVATVITSEYLAGTVDAVFLVYNEFKSAISQRVTVEGLLPLATGEPAIAAAGASLVDFKYEPTAEAVLADLVPLDVEFQIYRALLESIASEFGAKMSAMDSATRNATEMIGALTLSFNRARQAAITKELMEIIGGAEALKG
jgi:F-type H+-transporting ATPase subunit gamma